MHAAGNQTPSSTTMPLLISLALPSSRRPVETVLTAAAGVRDPGFPLLTSLACPHSVPAAPAQGGTRTLGRTTVPCGAAGKGTSGSAAFSSAYQCPDPLLFHSSPPEQREPASAVHSPRCAHSLHSVPSLAPPLRPRGSSHSALSLPPATTLGSCSVTPDYLPATSPPEPGPQKQVCPDKFPEGQSWCSSTRWWGRGASESPRSLSLGPRMGGVAEAAGTCLHPLGSHLCACRRTALSCTHLRP